MELQIKEVPGIIGAVNKPFSFTACLRLALDGGN